MHQASECLCAAVTDSHVCGRHMSTLINPGSSPNCMNGRTAKTLNLFIRSSTIKVSTAVDSLF